MARIDVHLKVVLDLDPEEKPEKVAAEIARLIRKVYGVREVEVTSLIQPSD
jgi:hypothetical protein